MEVDQSGFEFICANESFKSSPYQCQAGRWTLGFGHTEGVTETSAPITELQAQAILWQDLEPVEAWLDENILIPLSQCEFNALADFVFNLGIEKVKHSTLFRRLNSGDKNGASREFLKWSFYEDPNTKKMVHSQGLLARRQREQVLFLADFNEARNSSGDIA